MIKKIYFTLCFVLSAFYALADPHDCMSKEDAELLAQKVLNQYVMDYCDCCDAMAGDKVVYASLLLVTQAMVVPCSYDAERFSVAIKYTFLSAYNAKKGKLTAKGAIKQINKNLLISSNISLNYHFYMKNGSPERLYVLLDKKEEYTSTCWRLDRFPTAKEVGDKKYKLFMAK